MWTLELANSIVVFVGVHTGVRALWMVIAILGPIAVFCSGPCGACLE